MVVHRSGRREILVYDREDPDTCRTVLRLSADDTLTLVELLGAFLAVTMHLGQMQQELEGLTIDWLTVAPDAGCGAHTRRGRGALTHRRVDRRDLARRRDSAGTLGGRHVTAG